MKSLPVESAFTDNHSRALKINALVEFNLIPKLTPDMETPVVVDIMSMGLLPHKGELNRYREENRRKLLVKMYEWTSKKTAIDQQQFYRELALLANLDIDLLTPPYLKEREALKSTLESQAALLIAEQMNSPDPQIAQRIIEDTQNMLPETQTFIGEQFRMFSRASEDYQECLTKDVSSTDADDVAKLIQNIHSNYQPDLYLEQHLILATIVGRKDFVALLAKEGYTLQTTPEDLLNTYKEALNIKPAEPPTITL